MKVLFLGFLVAVVAAVTPVHAQQEDDDEDDPVGNIPRMDLVTFETLDFDNDGFIAKDEIEFFVDDQFTALNKKHRNLLKKIFLAPDVDKDGKVSKAEYALQGSTSKQTAGDEYQPAGDDYQTLDDIYVYTPGTPEYKKALKKLKKQIKLIN